MQDLGSSRAMLEIQYENEVHEKVQSFTCCHCQPIKVDSLFRLDSGEFLQCCVSALMDSLFVY